MLLLNDKQIKQKIKRLALEIVEHNYHMAGIILAGINNSGYRFAKLIQNELAKVYEGTLEVRHLKLNPASPTEYDITFESTEGEDLHLKTVIIIDDVANTGRTLFYAFKPFMTSLVAKVEVAVLVDRKHKRFPIKVDYYGLTLATTYNENIKVKIDGTSEMEVHLD
jgi:pyrimidine operon attenuation protein / uracil phosphoribosyltransferase